MGKTPPHIMESRTSEQRAPPDFCEEELSGATPGQMKGHKVKREQQLLVRRWVWRLVLLIKDSCRNKPGFLESTHDGKFPPSLTRLLTL